MFLLVVFVAYTNNAQEVFILEYANTEDVHVNNKQTLASFFFRYFEDTFCPYRSLTLGDNP